MISSFVVIFRETLEASLIVTIMLSYLYKIGQTKYNKLVWAGVVSGLVVSILLAIGFYLLSLEFAGRAEKVFEGTSMLVASVLITFMILWMIKRKQTLKKNIETKISLAIKKNERRELFLLPFIAVLREGAETVIFLSAILFSAQTDIGSMIIGSIMGLVCAVGLGYLIYRGSRKLNPKHFFTATTIVLIMLAAGLTAHGIHEFQEAKLLPTFVGELWNTNHLLDDKGVLGGTLRSLIGYQGNPSLLEVISYVTYLIVVLIIWRKIVGGGVIANSKN